MEEFPADGFPCFSHRSGFAWANFFRSTHSLRVPPGAHRIEGDWPVRVISDQGVDMDARIVFVSFEGENVLRSTATVPRFGCRSNPFETVFGWFSVCPTIRFSREAHSVSEVAFKSLDSAFRLNRASSALGVRSRLKGTRVEFYGACESPCKPPAPWLNAREEARVLNMFFV